MGGSGFLLIIFVVLASQTQDCDGAVVYKDCSSHGHVFEECSVSGVKTITNVWVHEKYSSSSCIYHSGDPPAQSNSKLPGKFGFTATTIWVNSGCRAKFAVTDAVDGGWGTWSAWGRCSQSCGGGTYSRTRACDRPARANGGADCSGDSSQSGTCNDFTCPIDGGWGSWTAWSTCTVSCGVGGGLTDRSRLCDSPSPDHGGAYCSGDGTEETRCNDFNCPIDGGWGSWTAWGACTLTCGFGDSVRTRACDSPEPQYAGANCTGDFSETMSCNDFYCPVDGGWSSWSEWSSCTVSCGTEGGTSERTRACDSPAMAHGGADCSGDSNETTTCNAFRCPIVTDIYTPNKYAYQVVDDDASDVTSTFFKVMTCNDAHVLLMQDSSKTKNIYEIVIAGWSNTMSVIRKAQQGTNLNTTIHSPLSCNEYRPFWISWGGGVIRCGTGLTVGENTYMIYDDPNPTEVNKVAISTGFGATGNWQFLFYITDGNWSTWTSWSSCSQSCGIPGGNSTRTRACDSPAPANGGQDCSGDTLESAVCNEVNCPVDGGWGSWTSWSACTLTCGFGDNVRTRPCDSPAPAYNGSDCIGSGNETLGCNEFYCPVDGAWGSWSAWSTCTVSCGIGGGVAERTRACDSPAADHGGLDCSGESNETTICNDFHCPIDGSWTSWSAWSSCGVTCGDSTLSRSRSCDNPAPQYNGTECPGSGTEETPCSTGVNCPIDGYFTTWSTWTTCTATCAGGTNSRNRTCIPPQYSGADCVGEPEESSACNTQNCPIDGGWAEWSSWGYCSNICGPGTTTRERTCSSPSPQYDGADCVGISSETTDCNGTCTVNGNWGTWSTWDSCTKTCDSGRQVRRRDCDSPAATPDGNPCYGDVIQSQACNTQNCSDSYALGQSHYVNICPSRYFTCFSGIISCIPQELRCDCNSDCEDGSDETANWAQCSEVIIYYCQSNRAVGISSISWLVYICVSLMTLVMGTMVC